MSLPAFRRSLPLLTLLPLLLAIGAGPPLRSTGETSAPPPEQVWEAGLKRLAGTYRFVQVASPGGLWHVSETDAERTRVQVSISQLPEALREKLENAEIQILELKLPTLVDASVRKSPGVGGMIRHYEEEAHGRLIMRGLPGVGDGRSEADEFAGEVVFGVDHSSISNPSVSGVWITRHRTEPTWGVAALDYADLTAMKPVVDEQVDRDPEYPLLNARILRSGLEIFAFVQWADPAARDQGRHSEYVGAVRLVRADLPPTRQ